MTATVLSRRLYLCCIAALALLVGCGGASSTAVSSGGTTGGGGGTNSSTKPILTGLVTMGPATAVGSVPANSFAELNAHPGVYSAAVVELYWSQLEPSQGVFNDSALTSALASLATYNTNNPTAPVVAKLRIFMGLGTPQWVINATGAVTFTNSSGSATIGEFWTPAYRALWQALQQHLASEYDTDSRIAEIAITSCSSLTGEPFVIPDDSTSIPILHAAGYTDALGMACLSGAPADYAAWTHTPLDYTFNPFQGLDTGSDVPNVTFTTTLMASFRASLGTRAVVANHDLVDPLNSGNNGVYGEFTTLYNQAIAATPATVSPLEFQTLSPTEDWTTAIPLGLTYHPTEIEIWDTTAAGGSAPLTLAQLQSWAAALK